MESLAYLHLELANQQPEVQQNTDLNSIGDSWNAAGWDEIFDTLDEEETEEEEELTPPNVPPIETQTKTPSCSEDRRDCMTQLSDWADQYRAELEKQSSARACEIESLLNAGDYEAIREWLSEWESEDKEPGSLRSRYRETRLELRLEQYRQRQHQLKGSVLDRITGKASTKSLTRSGADLYSQTENTESSGVNPS